MWQILPHTNDTEARYYRRNERGEIELRRKASMLPGATGIGSQRRETVGKPQVTDGTRHGDARNGTR